MRRRAELGDFTAGWRLLPMSAAAMAIGVLAAFVALALLRLIGFFTNLFFFQRLDFALVSPVGHHLGILVVVVPVLGALVIGLMARYGSERIAYRMAETGMTRLPVVERTAPRRLVGIIGLTDLLQARVRNLEAERRRERVLPLRLVLPWTRRGRRREVRAGSG